MIFQIPSINKKIQSFTLLSIFTIFLISVTIFNISQVYGEILHSKIDKEEYHKGENIRFSGTVDNPSETKPISIIVKSPNDNFVVIAQTKSDLDGNFEAYIEAGLGSLWNIEGIYTLTAVHDNNRIITHEFMYMFEQELEEYVSSDISEQINADTPNKQSIPEWIRTNAEWWTEDKIDDKTFASGLQFLIKEGIIDVPEITPKTPSDISSKEIPEWIKNNVDWWTRGLLSDADFLKGIEFMIKNGIITI